MNFNNTCRITFVTRHHLPYEKKVEGIGSDQYLSDNGFIYFIRPWSDPLVFVLNVGRVQMAFHQKHSAVRYFPANFAIFSNIF